MTQWLLGLPRARSLFAVLGILGIFGILGILRVGAFPARFLGCGTSVGSRAADCRDRVLEDYFFAAAGIQEQCVAIERLDPPGQLFPIHQEQRDNISRTSRSVEEIALKICWYVASRLRSISHRSLPFSSSYL